MENPTGKSEFCKVGQNGEILSFIVTMYVYIVHKTVAVVIRMKYDYQGPDFDDLKILQK